MSAPVASRAHAVLAQIPADDPDDLVQALRDARQRALDAIRHPRRYEDPEGVRAAALAEARDIQGALDERGINQLAVTP